VRGYETKFGPVYRDVDRDKAAQIVDRSDRRGDWRIGPVALNLNVGKLRVVAVANENRGASRDAYREAGVARRANSGRVATTE
jgi:hypothetical protein